MPFVGRVASRKRSFVTHYRRIGHTARDTLMGKFITRMRPGDSALQDRIFAEAHRLYESGTPLSEAIRRLLEIAGDNPNAFRGFTKKNTQGLNRTPEDHAILRLVGTASQEREDPNPLRKTAGSWWPPGD